MRAVLAAPPPTLLVIAKEPLPGRVKTRLTPPCTPEQAAALAEAALSDTLRTLSTVPAGRRVLVLDGVPGRWLPPGWEVVPQSPGGLDVRLAAAFAHAAPGAPALLVGMDTPQLTARMLAEPLSAARRSGVDAWYGPATDGGFWALGLARPTAELARRLLAGVPMSCDRTGAVLLARLSGLTVRHLPPLTDVDGVRDAAEVAALRPGGQFACSWRSVAGALGERSAPEHGGADR
ncbi:MULTISPECIES: TIGR04282 family arsenosugar biosynthesis glycosyltransferase [Kitasatospora]